MRFGWWLCAALILLEGVPAFAQSTAKKDASDDRSLYSLLEPSLKPFNPFMADGGAATGHDDSYSSDVSTATGPGSGALKIEFTRSDLLCPTLVLDKKGFVVAYCVDPSTKRAQVRLLAPDTLSILTSLELPTSGRLGGFHMYVDPQDAVLLGAGNNHLLRLVHSADIRRRWQLRIVKDWDLSADIARHCGGQHCDYLESVTPDWSGRIWFATEGGVVGTVDPQGGTIRSMPLPQGERITNSISSSPDGVAVASDHALYLLVAGADGTPLVAWREDYDRGTKIKPGQLTHGSGSTPVFFGREGHPYLAIVDNADSQEHLRVYRVKAASEGKRLVCEVPLFNAEASAAEGAPIAIGNSVVIENTFGYDYTDYAGARVRSLPGGLTRIDVRTDGSGCDLIWSNPITGSAVPKLSLRDGYIYAVERTLVGMVPEYTFLAIDFRTGGTRREQLLGSSYAFDTFQLPGVIAPHGLYYQPTVAGIIQVRRPR